MNNFDSAINVILEHAGGYSNDHEDSGGETNFGITQKSLDSWWKLLDIPATVKDLLRVDAIKYYKNVWWEKYNYGAINSLSIATKIFDMAVNMGTEEAHKLVQRALNCCGYHIVVDGILGDDTLYFINKINSQGGDKTLKWELCDEQKWFYEHLVEEHPELEKFLAGWLNRAAL